MVAIRKGMMRDCKDLLTVYQTTRWYYRGKEGGYQTVEEVKQEHKGIGFDSWGWLVAEEDDTIIGEIVFNVEKNPIAGRVGVIRNLDIDVRYQKRSIGTQLTRAAEAIMKEKKSSRVTLLTPPEAYNFWMKVDYFARGSLVDISTTLSKVKTIQVKGLKSQQLKGISRLPGFMKYSYLAVPGQFSELSGMILNGSQAGRVFQFDMDKRPIGIGAIVKTDKDTARFSVDMLSQNTEYLEAIISKLLSNAQTLKVKRIASMIPKDHLDRFKKSARWTVEDTRDIPITRLL